MSENELIRNSMGGIGEDDSRNDSIITLCEGEAVDQVAIEERFKKIYVPLPLSRRPSSTPPAAATPPLNSDPSSVRIS
jgi:hypothetical protein